jgi:hypothetical protein
VIGALPPKNWSATTLGAVAEIERDIVNPTDIQPGEQYVGLEDIGGDGAVLNRHSVTNGQLASAKFRFSPVHILYGKLRPYLRKIARPDFVGICSTDILPIRPRMGVSRDFLFHYLRHPRMIDEATARCAGANLPRLSPNQLASFPIFIPELAEQKRIAAILDKADAIRRRRAEHTQLSNAFPHALFLDLFGNPLSHSKGKWTSRSVESLCRLVRGSSPRPKGDPRYFDGPVARLMIEDITRDGRKVTPRIDSLTEEGAALSRPCPAGTVVMAVSGNVGLVAQLMIDACIHDGFVGFLDLQVEEVAPEYMLSCLDLLKATHARQMAGAIWQNLTTDQVKAMQIPIPPRPKQEFFCELLREHERAHAVHSSQQTAAEELSGALIQRAFRGEL